MERNDILDVRSLFLRPRPEDNAVTQRTTGPNRGTSTPEAAPRQDDYTALKADLHARMITELQEEIEEGLPAPRKREVKKQVRGELATLQETILRAFEKLEAELSDDEQQAACETVRDAVARSRYWSNARTALRGQGPAL